MSNPTTKQYAHSLQKYQNPMTKPSPFGQVAGGFASGLSGIMASPTFAKLLAQKLKGWGQPEADPVATAYPVPGPAVVDTVPLD
jgi:hypothetical protein